MRAHQLIRAVGVVAGVGLAALIVLAIGFESEDQVDPVRMRERTIAKVYGVTIFVGNNAPTDFALCFPSAVENREPGGWDAMRLWSFLGSPRFQSRTKRLVYAARSFIGVPEAVGMPADDADRFASRIIDLVTQRIEFYIAINDDLSVELRSGPDNEEVHESWRPPAP